VQASGSRLLALTGEQAKTLRELAAELKMRGASRGSGRAGAAHDGNGREALAALWSHASDDELMDARKQAERELAPYREKCQGRRSISC